MIYVDGSCLGNPGPIEYRGVDENGKELFRFAFPYGTNNIAEFLAIVHALGYCKKNGLDSAIYSDSKTGRAWVRDQRCNSEIKPHKDPNITKQLKFLIEKAETFLRTERPYNAVLLYNTKELGENPADFNRK